MKINVNYNSVIYLCDPDIILYATNMIIFAQMIYGDLADASAYNAMANQ